MRKTLVFVIQTSLGEEDAREKAFAWYSHKQNLILESVKPSKLGGYQVTLSYDLPK